MNATGLTKNMSYLNDKNEISNSVRAMQWYSKKTRNDTNKTSIYFATLHGRLAQSVRASC